MDDRHDLYGEEFLKNYLKAVRVTPDWDSFLNDKRVNWVLVPAGSSLANMLEMTSQWSLGPERALNVQDAVARDAAAGGDRGRERVDRRVEGKERPLADQARCLDHALRRLQVEQTDVVLGTEADPSRYGLPPGPWAGRRSEVDRSLRFLLGIWPSYTAADPTGAPLASTVVRKTHPRVPGGRCCRRRR